MIRVSYLFFLFFFSDGQSFPTGKGSPTCEGAERGNLRNHRARNVSFRDRRNHRPRRRLFERRPVDIQSLIVLRGPYGPDTGPDRDPKLSPPENAPVRDGHPRRQNSECACRRCR